MELFTAIHALEYLQSARSEKWKNKNVFFFLQQLLTIIIDPLEGLWSPLPPALGPEQKIIDTVRTTRISPCSTLFMAVSIILRSTKYVTLEYSYCMRYYSWLTQSWGDKLETSPNQMVCIFPDGAVRVLYNSCEYHPARNPKERLIVHINT